MRLRKMVNDLGTIVLGRDYTLLFSGVSRCNNLGVVEPISNPFVGVLLPTGRALSSSKMTIADSDREGYGACLPGLGIAPIEGFDLGSCDSTDIENAHEQICESKPITSSLSNRGSPVCRRHSSPLRCIRLGQGAGIGRGWRVRVCGDPARVRLEELSWVLARYIAVRSAAVGHRGRVRSTRVVLDVQRVGERDTPAVWLSWGGQVHVAAGSLGERFRSRVGGRCPKPHNTQYWLWDRAFRQHFRHSIRRRWGRPSHSSRVSANGRRRPNQWTAALD